MDNTSNSSLLGMSPKKSKRTIPASVMAQNTMNPIRRIVDRMKLEPNPDHDFISLSIGDPTIFGNLKPPAEVIKALTECLESGKYNGYAPATGYQHARESVAKYMSTPDSPLTDRDVVLASGCSGATELALGVLANPGDNILVPKPGFPLYCTIGCSYGFEVRHYKLLPEKSWEADLSHMESLIDKRTKCIVVNNPSNPCGSVYTEDHLKAILAVAEKYGLPILADEIYAYSVFGGETFIPLASLTKTVSVLSVGAISKRFLVPGWRLGWVLIHDRNGAFEEVRQGLFDLATRILGPNTLIQGALPEIFSRTPQSFFDETLKFIEKNADIAYHSLSMVTGLRPVKPRGAMYMMVGIDSKLMVNIKDDLEFTQMLVSEKSVFCLPGSCFQFPNFFRIVLTVPEELTRRACQRIADFCRDLLHSKLSNGNH